MLVSHEGRFLCVGGLRLYGPLLRWQDFVDFEYGRFIVDVYELR